MPSMSVSRMHEGIMEAINQMLCSIGLFAPRVGQQYRDEQRRRRSQFDRGTTAAEREIVYVRTLTPKQPSAIGSGLRSAPCTYPAMKMWYDPTIERGPRTS